MTFPVVLGGFVVFLAASVATFSAGDWPSPHQFPSNAPSHNACGVVGAWLAYQAIWLLGGGTWVVVLLLGAWVGEYAVRGGVAHLVSRAGGALLLLTAICCSGELLIARESASLPVGAGGAVGLLVGSALQAQVSSAGAAVVLGSAIIVGLLLATDGRILDLAAWLARRVAPHAVSAPLAAAAAFVRRAVSLFAGLLPALARSDTPPASTRAKARRTRQRGDGYAEAEDDAPAVQIVDPESADDADEDDEWEYEYEYEYEDDGEDEDDAEPVAEEEDVEPEPPAQPKKSRRPLKVNIPSPQRASRAMAYPKRIENWELPSIELLSETEYNFTSQQESVVREQARILEQTLEEFRLDAQVVEIDTGPVITMFELRLGAGIKVSQIASLSNDIARALKAHAIRVVAPISGKNTVGIEVPNQQKEQVRLRELMTVAGKKASDMALPLFLGKDSSGAALVADLAKMPHGLIAGTTGSGKSVCMNAVILSLLMTKRPDHVKMILVDPKMVEMSQFKSVPHLMCPIVTDMNKAQQILEWAVTKMEERYELLAEARVKNIAGYNRLGEEELVRRFDPQSDAERERIPKHLPFVVIFIDELADLMMTSGKEVEHHLSRLAQKSRAVGIHIIVATQRPEVKVVTGLIKSNLPSRICFRVASRMDSRIVLDQNGGEVLLGQGDMLFLPPGSHKLIRAQGTFLDDAEVQAVLDDLASRAEPDFHPELMRLKAPGSADGSMVKDPLFDDAVRVVLQSKRGSVSLLQRRLTIGYSRASRLIEQMGEAGIVGEYKGSQAREVSMTLEEWDALRKSVDQDVEQGYEADEMDDASGDYEEFDDAEVASSA